jgi:hypothetical protein
MTVDPVHGVGTESELLSQSRDRVFHANHRVAA